jgi:ribosomal protein L10
MIEIASIPGREVLLSKLVNILNSPIQRFVVALDQISLKK